MHGRQANAGSGWKKPVGTSAARGFAQAPQERERAGMRKPIRRKSFVAVMILIVTVSMASSGIGAAAGEERPKVRSSFEVQPAMELLAGVLAQTEWGMKYGPVKGGSAYYRALKDFMAEYRTHQAVLLAQELAVGDRFVFDAPPAFICHLGPLPDLELQREYTTYLVKRARSREKLEDFRLALKDLASVSGFMEFFEVWRKELERIAAMTEASCGAERTAEWLSRFFGWDQERYRVVFSPGMYSGCYGVELGGSGGGALVVICALDSAGGTPVTFSGQTLDRALLHEWGHRFINPSLEACPQQIHDLAPLYETVAKSMKDQNYGLNAVFWNEQVLRAATCLASRELHGEDAFKANVQNNESWGFFLTGFVVGELEYYQAHRDQYPTFREFVPCLLDRLKQYQVEMGL